LRARLFGPIDVGAALADLHRRAINYDPSTAPQDGRADGHWHVDSGDTVIGREPPGRALPDDVFARACFLVRCYEFSNPRILRAVYRGDAELLGRDMLLEGRFFGLRFYLGVRVTAVLDETRDTEHVWGWSYQTLSGHLEQGRLTYEVIKNLDSGVVSFRVSGYSRAAPIRDPLIRLGFGLFGRWTQRRFYLTIQQRMRALLDAGLPLPTPMREAGGLVIAPSDAERHPAEWLARRIHHPGE
jgi:uncharacterized protein (UPF0548 family)